MATNGVASALEPEGGIDKLLSFLGTSEYQLTTYRWGELEYSTRFVTKALVHWLQPKEVVIFLTPEARNSQRWGELQHQLSGLTAHIQPVEIPKGDNEQELWAIFEQIIQAVEERESIAIDVTHAFRSLPMLLLTVAAFLQASKGVKIQHIFYGRFERDQSQASPVLDLVLLLHLLDWMEAARRFRERGDASWIGEQLQAIHDALRRSKTAEPQKLKTAGARTLELSLSFQLARPLEAAKTADQLARILPEAVGEIADHAKPFRLLIKDLQEQVADIARHEPRLLDEQNLRSQLRFIRRLGQFGLYMQATQMAREWVVNWCIWQDAGRTSVDGKRWLNREVREEVESLLGGAFPPSGGQEEIPDWLHEEDTKILRTLWPALCHLRNDLAHCGMRLRPLKAKDLVTNLEKCIEDLDALMKSSSHE